MQLVQMTNDGTYWLKAENEADAKQLQDFRQDVMIDDFKGHKIGLTEVTVGAFGNLPMRLELQICKPIKI